MDIAPTGLTAAKRLPWKVVLLLHALSCTCFILVCYFLPVSFALTSVKNLMISEATANGIDIGLRVGLVYKFLGGGTALTLLFFYLFKMLGVKMNTGFLRREELVLFSVTTICLSLLQVMGIQCIVVLCILQLVFWIRFVLLLPLRALYPLTAALKGKSAFSLCLVFAFFILFAVFVLWGTESWVKGHVALLYALALLACCGAWVLGNTISKTKQNIAFPLMLPLAGIPLLAFMATETLFYIREKNGYILNHEVLFVLLCLCLCVVVYLRHFLFKRKKPYATAKIVKNILAPAVLLGFTLLVAYTPLLPQQSEMFESANPANAVMNMFRFGELPVLDFMSSHLLSEQWYGFLYATLFGFNGQRDFMVYGFLNLLLFYGVLYCFLDLLFSRPLLSVYFILLFPFTEEFFYPSVFLAVLPLFFSKRLLLHPSPWAFFGLFLTLFLLLLWKLDAGAASLIASFIYFPLLWIVARKRFPLSAFLKGLGLFVLLLIAVTLLCFLLRSPEQIWTHFLLALHYFTANQAHGYYQILHNFTQQFYTYHVLAPFVAVVLCLYIVATLRKRGPVRIGTDELLLLSALFLFLLFLANLQRGMVRHGFAEHGDIILISTFFAALALVVLHGSRFSMQLTRMSVFFGSAFLIFITLKFFPYQPERTPAETALTQNAFEALGAHPDLNGYSGREFKDTAFAHEHYSSLKRFLDNQIRPQQTFLDFSNTPILYFYCSRRVPGYFNQNLQNTVDDYLQLGLLKDVDTQKVPIVVFASYPRTWMDATDDIPNVMRYYLVAEYIFAHYRPFEVMGNKSIWVAKSFNPKTVTGITDTLLAKTDSVWMNLIPEYTGMYYNNQDGKGTKELVSVYTREGAALRPGSDSTLSLILDSSVTAVNHCYLDIEFNRHTAPFDAFRMNVLLLDTAQTTVGVFSFVRRDWVSSRYMIRLSNHYFWHQHKTLELRIPMAGDIKRISILKDMRIEN